MSTWKIGKIGEKLVEDYLIRSNWLIYPAPDERHPVDWFLATKDKKDICIADAKTKPARVKYNDTGINLTHYREYEYLQKRYNVDAFVIWVDPDAKRIYGNRLGNLTKQVNINGKRYPSIEPTNYGKDIIYFPLTAMGEIASLSDEQAQELMKLSNRNPDYKYSNQPRPSIVMQPALFDSPYKPKQRKTIIHNHDDPKFLKQLLLIKTCECGQNKLNPNLHDNYCEYRTLLLRGQDESNI